MSSLLFKENPFQKALLNKRPLLLDGAMGSYIQQKRFETDDALWTTNINSSNPDEIIKIHQEYIASGADIITTNTFRTNPVALQSRGISDFSKYVKQAVQLAIQPIEDKQILIAGSNAPAEDCYQIERTISYNKLELNHKNHIDLLMDNDVDLILNETQSHFDEIQIICEHCDKNSIPYLINIYFNDSFKILSGEGMDFILSYLKDHSLLAVGFNCIQPYLFVKLIGSTKLPNTWGFYLNCGSGNPSDKFIECGINPEEYIEVVKKSLDYKPSFVGSCCGSNPAHTKKMREFLDEYICN